MLAYQERVTALSIRVLSAFAAALEQPENVFEPIYTPAPNQLRQDHSLSRPRADEGDQGVGAHKDSGFVTILLQDKQAGLQVQGERRLDRRAARRGNFRRQHRRDSRNGLQRLSARQRPSGGLAAAGDRSLSVAFFLGARLDATVPLLSLPPDLAAQARGLTQDPQNPLFREVGRNYLKSRLRSHPDVARRHHADLIDSASAELEQASAY